MTRERFIELVTAEQEPLRRFLLGLCGGNRMEYYQSLIEMSAYLRHLVTERRESAWIAQRNGRTKDGIDRTDPALLKMIAATGNPSDPVGALHAMHIVPLCISYEWEPCGRQKAREVCLRRQGPYVKAPGEDTQSIVNGIMDFKGRVHLSVCPPLTLDELATTDGDFHQVAALIDRHIAQGRTTFDNNRIAKAMLDGTPLPDSKATADFQRYIDDACAQYPDCDNYRTTLLQIYANSV